MEPPEEDTLETAPSAGARVGVLLPSPPVSSCITGTAVAVLTKDRDMQPTCEKHAPTKRMAFR